MTNERLDEVANTWEFGSKLERIAWTGIILSGSAQLLLSKKGVNHELNGGLFTYQHLWYLGIGLIAAGMGAATLGQAAMRKNASGESNELVTSGPYHVVRNPIYLSMRLMSLGVLFMSPTLPVAGASLALFACSEIAVRLEEKKLKEWFGRAYESYKEKVPAWIPGLNYVKNFFARYTH